MEYKVIDEQSRELLEERVNQDISVGWMPIGGVSVYATISHFRLTQAMIKQPPTLDERAKLKTKLKQ